MGENAGRLLNVMVERAALGRCVVSIAGRDVEWRFIVSVKGEEPVAEHWVVQFFAHGGKPGQAFDNVSVTHNSHTRARGL